MKAVQHISNRICIQHTLKPPWILPFCVIFLQVSSFHNYIWFIVPQSVFFTQVLQNSWSWPTVFPAWSFQRKSNKSKYHYFMKCQTSACPEWWLSGGRDGEGGKPVNYVCQLIVPFYIILLLCIKSANHCNHCVLKMWNNIRIKRVDDDNLFSWNF
jgi:hypothetical protein